MNKRLVIMLMLSALLSSKSQAAKVWDTGNPIFGGSITYPTSSGRYLCGSRVYFTCSRSSDTDRWVDNCQEGKPSDTMSPSYPRWSASSGSFEDGDYIGTYVYWIAPNSETSNIYVTVWENDLPYPIPPGDSGTRDDTSFCIGSKNNISTIIPSLYTLQYGGGNHPIFDVTTPEYYPGRNEPASWSFGANATATTKFWHPNASKPSWNRDYSSRRNFRGWF